MADETQDQPTSPVDLLIPPFPEPKDWLKQKQYKPINLSEGEIFRSHFLDGLLLSADERERVQLAKMRAHSYQLEQAAHVQKYATLAAHALTNPTLGSLYQPGTPGQAGSPGNLQDVMNVVRGPQPVANPVGPELQTGAPDLQAGIQPPNAGQMLTMPTPAIAPKSATLGGVPVNPAAAATIERPDVSKMRIDPAHVLTLLTQPKVLQHIIPEGGTLAITDAQGNVVNQIQNPNANYKHLGNDLTGVMKANNLNPDKPEDVAKARDIMLSEKPDVKSQNAAMEIVTKGATTRFSDGTYQQKADALRYAASINPTARIDITNLNANRDVIPEKYGDLHGEDYIKTLPRGKQNEVRAITNYQMSPTQLSSMRTGAREELMQHVLQVDPSFSIPEYGSRSAALSQLAAQEGKVGAFEKTFRKNIDLADQLSSKVHRASGVPIFNAWVQAGQRSVTGDPDITALDVAIKSVVNEFARITTSASGSGQNTAEGEIKKIEGLLKAAQTPAQFKAVLNTMRTETSNRMASFAEQKALIKSGGTAPAGTGAPKVINFKDLP